MRPGGGPAALCCGVIFRAVRPLLALAAMACAGWGQGAEVPLFLGPVLPAAPLTRPSCAPPTDPLERAVWQVVTRRGPDLSCGNAFVGYLRTPRGLTTPLDAFEVTGAVRGTALTAWRLVRCNPLSRGGVDHVPGSCAHRRSEAIWAGTGPWQNGPGTETTATDDVGR